MSNRISAAILGCFCLASSFWALAQGQAAGPDLAQIRAELLEIGAADQAVRATRPGTANPVHAGQMWEVDANNQVRLKKIIAQIGWPTRQLVGDEANRSAILIAQHAIADLALMQMAFNEVEAEYKAGTVPAGTYARMKDRILMLQDQPQQFGTQITISGGECRVWKLANPATIEQVRAQMGLERLADYTARICAGGNGKAP